MKVKEWLSGLAGVISIISGCSGEAMNKETTEFEWYAVATAPRDYPMEVINGTFFYQGQSQGGGYSVRRYTNTRLGSFNQRVLDWSQVQAAP